MIKDILKDEITLDDLKDHGKSWNTSDEAIQDIGKEKIDSLNEIISEITLLIKNREKLSSNISSEIERMNVDIDKFISENALSSPEDSKERSALRQKQVELAELSMNERVSCWKDIAQLKKELRECNKELTEKQDRMNTINKLFEEN